MNGTSAQRQDGAFYAKVPTDNTTLPSWAKITIDASAGTDTTSQTRHSWVPKTPEVYRYDADGNLIEDGRWIYGWDAENRLTSMETRPILLPPTGSFPFSERRRLEFAYDAQGRRIQKKVFGWGALGWTVLTDVRFLYDGWNLLADLNGQSSNAVVCSYVWGLDLSGSLQGAGGVGGLLLTTKAGSTYATGYDGNGNVQTLINLADGSTSADFEYDPFGNTLKATGTAANACPFGFSTKYTDSETGLLYYGYRFYSPSTGRWLSRDPIEENGGENLYGFCANNALSLIDRNGYDFATWAGAGPAYNHWTGSPLPTPRGPDAGTLTWSWFSGNGKYQNVKLGPTDTMTQNMQRSTVMEIDRQKLRERLRAYCKAGGAGGFSMQIGNELSQIPWWKYLTWELPTSLLINTDSAFIGSFTTGMVTAKSVECSKCKANIHVHGINYTGISSATHGPPRNGQYGPGRSGLNDNMFGPDGMMHTIEQTFDWDEEIHF